MLNSFDSEYPLIIERSEHCISRKMIDEDALKVMRRLLNNGYKAYLVGGGVRDLLLNKRPKDFDIATDATPQKVRALFRNSRIIGRRFPINHVYFKGNKIIEVATFRAVGDVETQEIEKPLPIKKDDTYGNPESDALRRDLTINGLFYDLDTFSIIDYVGGIEDLRNGVIRIIGDPDKRIVEDPVRMIRACRHAARTGFGIDRATYKAICDNAQFIKLSSPSRVSEEFVRELRGGSARASFELMKETRLLKYVSAPLWQAIERDSETWPRLELVLARIDDEFAKGTDISAAVLFLALVMGRIAFDMFESLGVEADGDALAPYWQVCPETLEELDLTHCHEADNDIELPRRQGRRRDKRSASSLLTMINKLFLPFGVSRKDREDMEKILRLRHFLLLHANDKRKLSQFRNNPTAQDAIMLMQLTLEDTRKVLKLRRLLAEPLFTTKGNNSHSPQRRNHRARRGRGRTCADVKKHIKSPIL
ncbi:MAG: polynucleotide adenylyltransferase PcnB [Deltaproteobacteria bacterium]|nr:polynucleotide adenylyltransferase PcnB [Deltaproteobacteria bacterium]